MVMEDLVVIEPLQKSTAYVPTQQKLENNRKKKLSAISIT